MYLPPLDHRTSTEKKASAETSHPGVEKWVHISDLHFGTEQEDVCQALRDLIDLQQPAGLVISGDVTQRAKSREFLAAKNYLSEVGAGRHVLVVPGNHDVPLFRVWERATGPYRLFKRSFGVVEQVRIEDIGHFRFVLVNTTRWFRHKRGTLSRQQVDEVEKAVAAAAPKVICAVVLHHPLPAFDDAGGRFPGDFAHIHDAETALDRWAKVGLDLVFCGHTHHPRVLRLTDIKPPRGLMGDPGTRAEEGNEESPPSAEDARARAATTPWLIQAGTSLSHRLRREPNSLYVLSVSTPAHPELEVRSRPHLRLERWDFILNTQKFERVEEVVLN